MLRVRQPLKRVGIRNSGNRGYTFLSSNKLTNNRISSADPSTSFDPSRCEIKANLHRPQRSTLQWKIVGKGNAKLSELRHTMTNNKRQMERVKFEEENP